MPTNENISSLAVPNRAHLAFDVCSSDVAAMYILALTSQRAHQTMLYDLPWHRRLAAVVFSTHARTGSQQDRRKMSAKPAQSLFSKSQAHNSYILKIENHSSLCGFRYDCGQV